MLPLHIAQPIYLISLRETMALSPDMRSLGWCDRRARCGVLGTYGVFDETSHFSSVVTAAPLQVQ